MTANQKSAAEPTGNQTGLIAILLSNLAKASEPELRERLIAAIARLQGKDQEAVLLRSIPEVTPKKSSKPNKPPKADYDDEIGF